MLVLDGNLKNRRDVCYAKDAGFIQFEGLSGSIKTGCPATPTFKSRFCDQHNNQTCTLSMSEEVDEDLDVPSGPRLRAMERRSRPGEPILEMILA